MRLFTSKEFDSLECLFWDQARDLYDAENRLLVALPKMADAATSPRLKQAFTTHLQETKTQVKRLEEIFRRHGKDAKRESCAAMKGIVAEGEEVISAKAPADIKDHALIVAAQRVEHYEMAGYGGARALAERCGFATDAELLQQTLDEEGHADHLLTEIASSLGRSPVHK